MYEFEEESGSERTMTVMSLEALSSLFPTMANE